MEKLLTNAKVGDWLIWKNLTMDSYGNGGVVVYGPPIQVTKISKHGYFCGDSRFDSEGCQRRDDWKFTGNNVVPYTEEIKAAILLQKKVYKLAALLGDLMKQDLPSTLSDKEIDNLLELLSAALEEKKG